MIAGEDSSRGPSTLTRWQSARALLIAALGTLALGLVFAFQGFEPSPRIEPGQVSTRTLLAPADQTFISEILTEEERNKAEAEVKEVYDPPDLGLARERVRFASRVFDYLDSVRNDPYSPFDRKLEWARAIPTPTLSTAMLSQTLMLDAAAFGRVVSETLYVIDATMQNTIRAEDLPTEYARLAFRVSRTLTPEQVGLVTQWAQAFVTPNSFPNARKTAELRTQARASVKPISRKVQKGQALVREGEIITPLALEALQAVGLVRPSRSVAATVGAFLFGGLLAVLLSLYVIRLRPALIPHPRALLLIAFLILLFALGAKLIGGDRTLLRYLYPTSAAVMLLAVLVDSGLALAAAVVLALSFGFFSGGSLEFTFYTLAGGIVAALCLGRIERLNVFIWSGGYVAAANAAVVAIFGALAGASDLATLWQSLGIAIANGALAGLIALGSLFLLGKGFGITTSLELFDLARPTHPLLQHLLAEAPGTYHHSLLVSQLAEQAAQRIGADALLVRVGAYYHDVGKTRNPQCFVENQMDGVNIHDTLDPKTSAAIVIEHVPRGIALARKHALPARLIEFIPQHHGTTLAAYFHRQAVKASGETPVDEQAYRYPGPKPQSREAAILMLADGVEATARAERPTSPEEMRAIIERIVNERLREGQLDESDLTLRNIQEIKDAFFDVLQGWFHPRIKYPEAPRALASEPWTVDDGRPQG